MKVLALIVFILLAVICAGSRFHSTVASAASQRSGSGSFITNASSTKLNFTRWWSSSTLPIARTNNAELTFNLAPPVAVNDTYTVHGGLQLTPTTNDSSGGDSIHIQSLTQPAHGSASLISAHVISYGAVNGYVGPDSFNYTVCNTQQECSSATITVSIVNQVPTAQTDSYTAHGGIQITPTANDSDPDGDSLLAPSIVTQPQHGALVPFNSHVFTYGANNAYVGSDSFTYRICDVLGACSEGVVIIDVVNQAPVAVPDLYVVRPGIEILPLENDFDPDPQDSLTAPTIVTQTQHGILTAYTPHFFLYAPYGGFAGTDSFTYRVCDNLGLCSIGTATIWVPGDGENDGTTSCNGRVGEPVNVTNGNMYLHQSDYQLPGVGYSIEVARTYNSNSQRIGLFGRGWTTPYDESITVYDSNLVRLNQPDGRAIYLGRPVGSSGALSPLEGDFHGSLVQNGGSGFTLTMKDGSVHQFNSAGKLLSLTDRSGNQTTLAYNLSGKLSSVTDPFGRILSFLPNLNGRVISIADTTGIVADYTYGGGGELISVTYADNSSFQFSYDGNFRLTSVTDALGNILEAHTYDAQGRALTSEKHGGVELYTLNYVSDSETHVTDALSHLTKFTIDKSKGRNVVTRVEGLCSCGGGSSQVQTWTYDSQLNLTAKTDALNHTETFTYDGNGNRLTETDATGTVTFTYNQYGQVLTRTDQMNGVTTNTYGATGNLLTTKDALNNTTTMTYDFRGQLLTVTDARGKLTTFTWDTSGRLTERKDALNHTTTFAYDARARVTSVTDALSQTTNYEYDLAGRIKKVIYPDTNFVLFTYDLAGRRTKIKDPRGNETNFAFDNAYRLTSQTDAASQTTSFGYDLMSNLTSKTDALGRVTDYEYDDFNRLEKAVYPAAFSGATRLQETIEYDAAGNVSKKTDTAARDTTYLYDAADRLTKITDQALQETEFEYNARSQTTKVIDALNQQYLFGYDALGRVTQTTRAGLSMSSVYDAVGNRTQRTDYNGAITNYTFDDLNRLTGIAYPDLTSASYGYDALSRPTSATNQNGTVSFVYDSRDRITSTTDVWSKTIGYSYDTNGNRTALTVGGAGYASYQYDSINRLTNLADSASQNFVYSHDVVNRLTSRVAPNGVTTSFSYDGLDRLFELKHMSGVITLANNQYGYNNTNNIMAWIGSAGNRGFGYDAADRLTSVTKMGGNESYGYDAVGNRTTSHLSTSYSHQPFNKLTSTATATYSYDNNGNLLSKTDGSGTRTFNWDSEHRLKQVTLPGGLTVSYKYDALGRRIQRTTSAGADERFVYDGQDVLLDLNSSLAVTTSYINGLGIDDHLRQTNTTTGVSYFLTDHLGSTAALTNASGSVVETLAYDSFGNNAGSARTRYTYTGRERDPDTGLLYYRARFYDPQVGRFTSEDPIQFDGGLNWYGYVENDPIQFSDPTGLSKGDRWYGYRNRDFHKWFHRCWKEPGDPDADKQGIEEAHREWVSRGSPKGGNCWGGEQPEPTECREPRLNPKRVPSRIPMGPSQFELDSFAEAARQLHEFWKKVTLGGYLVGSVLTAGALSGGSAATAPWLVPLFAP